MIIFYWICCAVNNEKMLHRVIPDRVRVNYEKFRELPAPVRGLEKEVDSFFFSLCEKRNKDIIKERWCYGGIAE